MYFSHKVLKHKGINSNDISFNTIVRFYFFLYISYISDIYVNHSCVKFVVWILSVEQGMERLIIVYEKLCVQMKAPWCNPIDSVKFH